MYIQDWSKEHMSPAVICVEKSVTLHHDMSNFADGCTHKILSEYTEGLERYGKIKVWRTDRWMDEGWPWHWYVTGQTLQILKMVAIYIHQIHVWSEYIEGLKIYGK